MNLTMETVKQLSQLHDLGQTALMLVLQHYANTMEENIDEKCLCCGGVRSHSDQCEVAIIYAKVQKIREERFKAMLDEAVDGPPSPVDRELGFIQPLPSYKTEPSPLSDTK